MRPPRGAATLPAKIGNASGKIGKSGNHTLPPFKAGKQAGSVPAASARHHHSGNKSATNRQRFRQPHRQLPTHTRPIPVRAIACQSLAERRSRRAAPKCLPVACQLPARHWSPAAVATAGSPPTGNPGNTIGNVSGNDSGKKNGNLAIALSARLAAMSPPARPWRSRGDLSPRSTRCVCYARTGFRLSPYEAHKLERSLDHKGKLICLAGGHIL